MRGGGVVIDPPLHQQVSGRSVGADVRAALFHGVYTLCLQGPPGEDTSVQSAVKRIALAAKLIQVRAWHFETVYKWVPVNPKKHYQTKTI